MGVFTSVEVCAGAGGQALGLEMAGFQHLACVEIDASACETLRANRGDEWNVIEADLRTWDPHAGLRGTDLLAGGVPCPPFSLAGRQLGRYDERDLFPDMIRLAESLRPRAVLIENVRGILSRKFDAYRDEIVERFGQLGYEFCGWELLNAKDFGVPQARQRALLVVMEPEAAEHFKWPQPEVGDDHVTVAEALAPFLEHWEGYGSWAQKARGLAPALVGGSKKHGGADLGPTRAKAAWRELGVDGMGVANEPPAPDHEGHIRLTVAMAAAIQGFPADWVFQGRKTAAYRQVGNAFPPPVARRVAEAIRDALFAAASARTLTA